ncbi:hypothetical protein [Thermosphaera sp.]
MKLYIECLSTGPGSMVLGAELASASFNKSLDVGIAQVAFAKVRELVSSQPVSGPVLEMFFRKAVRTGAWGRLSPVSKALLLASRRLVLVKSPVLRSILLNIMAEIEMYTTRGRAVYYGVVVALKKNMVEALSSLNRLVTLGIAYLSLPPLWRVFG